MEVVSQVQSLFVEHAFIIGIGLLIGTVIMGIAWYWMSRGSSKSTVLENQARVNTVEMDIPEAAAASEPQMVHESQGQESHEQESQEQ